MGLVQRLLAPGAGTLTGLALIFGVCSADALFNEPIRKNEAGNLLIEISQAEHEMERSREIALWLANGGHEWLKKSGVDVPDLNQLIKNNEPSELLLNSLDTNGFYLSQILEAGIVPYVFYEHLYNLEQRLRQNPSALKAYLAKSPPHVKEVFVKYLAGCNESEENLLQPCGDGLFQRLLAKINASALPFSEKINLLTRNLTECKTTVSNSLESEFFRNCHRALCSPR